MNLDAAALKVRQMLAAEGRTEPEDLFLARQAVRAENIDRRIAEIQEMRRRGGGR